MSSPTKQSQTKGQVLDLIERLDVGEAIPSERQLSADPIGTNIAKEFALIE